ncbi:MAG: P-II family nitrogen regulator [Candidatus ainarchaeum sp.]|nr:P-II family nitrogen regulator [Candidatus ainarchaeum sp.]
MKMITALIRPEQAGDVKRALEAKGFAGMTVTDAMGRGEQRGLELKSGSCTTRIDLLPKTELMLVVDDKREKLALETIVSSARTGKIGDGRIFVCDVKKSIRIRTGEVEA